MKFYLQIMIFATLAHRTVLQDNFQSDLDLFASVRQSLNQTIDSSRNDKSAIDLQGRVLRCVYMNVVDYVKDIGNGTVEGYQVRECSFIV